MNIYNVSDVNRLIKGAFDREAVLSSIYIRGEISNFKLHSSGHCYFTLKDQSSLLRVVMFKSRAQYLKFVPNNGLKVIAAGRITVFERDGQYQLYAEQLVPDGIGELSLAYEQLKEKLSIEGLFDAARKRILPIFPQRIGVITSPTGAALRDIVSVSQRRHAHVQLFLYPVQVQGNDAPLQIVHAIQIFNKLKNVDVLIVGRGGGSLEELWAFNDERVVRAIAGSEIPTVSAVGHQTDFTLADFAADCRAATPSQAAELIVPDSAELLRHINSLTNTLAHCWSMIISKYRQRLNTCMESRVLLAPEFLIHDRRQIIDILTQKMGQAIKDCSLSKQHKLQLAMEKLSLLSPLAVLLRGYSIVQNEENHVITDASTVVQGQQINITLHHGIIQAVVRNTREE